MTTILVTSASYIFTDYLLSSEGISCYKIFQKMAAFGYNFEAISAMVRVKEPLPNVSHHQVGSSNASPTDNLPRKYFAHVEFLFQSYRKSKELLKKKRIDIIHHMLPAVNNQTLDLLALLRKKERQPFVFGPISAHVYPRPKDEKALWTLTRKLHRETVKRCDKLVTITNLVRGLYSGFFPKENIWTIPLGVDTDVFRPQSDVSTQESSEILFSGYLYRLKGVEHLLRAMYIVSKTRKNVRLRIVGDGPERKNLSRLAKELGIEEKTIFEGLVPHTRMPYFYNHCDVFCFPTLGEPFGKAIVEAMACGKPVIASDVGGATEIIQNERNGVLVKPAKPKLLAEWILNLLEDEKRMKDMGRAAREIVLKKYSWEVIAEEYDKLYKSVV